MPLRRLARWSKPTRAPRPRRSTQPPERRVTTPIGAGNGAALTSSTGCSSPPPALSCCWIGGVRRRRRVDPARPPPPSSRTVRFRTGPAQIVALGGKLLAVRGLSDNVLEVILFGLSYVRSISISARTAAGVSRVSAATTRRACGPTTPTGRLNEPIDLRRHGLVLHTLPPAWAPRGGSAFLGAHSRRTPASARCWERWFIDFRCAARFLRMEHGEGGDGHVAGVSPFGDDALGMARFRRRLGVGRRRRLPAAGGLPADDKVTGWVRFRVARHDELTGRCEHGIGARRRVGGGLHPHDRVFGSTRVATRWGAASWHTPPARERVDARQLPAESAPVARRAAAARLPRRCRTVRARVHASR